jgi:hypothetical protein
MTLKGFCLFMKFAGFCSRRLLQRSPWDKVINVSSEDATYNVRQLSCLFVSFL